MSVRRMKGGGSTDSTVTTTQTNLPAFAEPYYHDLMQRTASATSEPYQQYGGQRVADFSPYEQEAMSRMGQLGMSGTNPALQEAGQVATRLTGAGLPGIDMVGDPGYRAGRPSWSDEYDPQTSESMYQAGSRQSGYNPDGYSSGYQPGFRDSGYQAGSRESGFQGDTRDVNFDPGRLDDPETLQNYMSPYMQNVVDVEKREAARQGDIRGQGISTTAAGSGSLGGYREAIMQAENERNLMQQMGDIQTRGQQAAFADAKQSFEQDRGARAKREELGQSQFGLNADQKQQREAFMQSQFGQNEQAKQQHEAFMQSQFGQNEQARQQAEQLMQQGWSMSDAAQQAKEQFAQSQFGQNEQAKQQEEAFRQGMFGMNSQNLQFGANQEVQRYQAYEQAKQFAAQLGLSADQANQMAQQAMMQGQLGLQQNQLGAAGMLGGFANQQQQQELERLGLLQGIGTQQRNLAQAGLDAGYADYQRQQAYPYEQLAFMSNIMQGNAVAPGSTTTMFGQQPSGLQQMLGGGIAGLGMYNAYQGMNQGG